MARSKRTSLFSEEAEERVVDTPVVSNPPAVDEPEDDIQDIDLSVIQKKKFRINGDKNKILELNTSDLGVATRLDVAYKRLNALMDEVGAKLGEIPDDATEEEAEKKFTEIKDTLEELDKKMRENVDYIFNANVSEMCASDGSMWDPINGAFRFEHIIDTISRLYENNLNAEFEKMRSRVNRKVTQYTKKKRH